MVMVTKSGHNGENKPAKIVQESVRVKALERLRERARERSVIRGAGPNRMAVGNKCVLTPFQQ